MHPSQNLEAEYFGFFFGFFWIFLEYCEVLSVILYYLGGNFRIFCSQFKPLCNGESRQQHHSRQSHKNEPQRPGATYGFNEKYRMSKNREKAHKEYYNK
jgi:hypothetical protein